MQEWRPAGEGHEGAHRDTTVEDDSESKLEEGDHNETIDLPDPENDAEDSRAKMVSIIYHTHSIHASSWTPGAGHVTAQIGALGRSSSTTLFSSCMVEYFIPSLR